METKTEYMRIIAFLMRNEMIGVKYNEIRNARRKLLAMGYEKRGQDIFISPPFIAGRTDEKLNAIQNCTTRNTSIMATTVSEKQFSESKLIFYSE